MAILRAYRAAPAPAPIQQTHQAVRKLFGGHDDLFQRFEEWLPKPVEQSGITLEPAAFVSRVYNLEKKVHGLEEFTRKRVGINGCSASHRTDSVRIAQLEREMGNLKAKVGVLGAENETLRDRIRQLDSYQAGP